MATVDADQRFRDWKTGNYYLYARPEPGSPLSRLRCSVSLEWYDYLSHPRWLGGEYQVGIGEHPKM